MDDHDDPNLPPTWKRRSGHRPESPKDHRRSGLMLVILVIVLGALIAGTVAALLLSDDDESSTATTTQVVEETTPPPTEQPDAEQGVIPGTAQCRTNRTASSPFGLTFSRVVRTQRGLLAEWQTNRPMPPSGVVLYAIDAFDDAGNVYLQLAVKYLDGAQIAFFVYDGANFNQMNLSGGGIRNGLRLEAIFPQDAISDLEGRFRWRAALSVEADDAITCPPGRGNPLGPTLPFPGR